MDLAWVLIKTKDYTTALAVIDEGLKEWPGNPWLLSVRATTLFEAGRINEALITVYEARDAVQEITPIMWAKAYPGNDPAAAGVGIETIRNAVAKNVEIIEAKAREVRN